MKKQYSIYVFFSNEFHGKVLLHISANGLHLISNRLIIIILKIYITFSSMIKTGLNHIYYCSNDTDTIYTIVFLFLLVCIVVRVLCFSEFLLFLILIFGFSNLYYHPHILLY